MPAIFSSDGQSFGFFEDRSKCAHGLKSSLYVELLQCTFFPVRYPLNIGYHGKARRVKMVILSARPRLGSIFNAFDAISIDLWAVLDVGCFLCSQGLARRMVFARRINVLMTDLLYCAGWCESKAKYLLV